MDIMQGLIAIPIYLLIGALLFGADQKWDILSLLSEKKNQTNLFGEQESDADKIIITLLAMVFWPLLLALHVLLFLKRVLLFFYHGFVWRQGRTLEGLGESKKLAFLFCEILFN